MIPDCKLPSMCIRIIHKTCLKTVLFTFNKDSHKAFPPDPGWLLANIFEKKQQQQIAIYHCLYFIFYGLARIS